MSDVSKQWIAVTDRLPPTNEHIIVYDDGVGTAFFLSKDISAIASGHPSWHELTHWMSLPDAPNLGE